MYEGQPFFVDIRRDGIALYELDDEPLAEPKPQTPTEGYRPAKEHFEDRLPHAKVSKKRQHFVSARMI
ncbi:hypothetical protein U8C36_31165 (plasmid) [Sinorhizobium medicae]|nr:hypothetical protein [Sinorhizobium medicae]WQO56646.1 hypothetical protein U8C36_31165 [Sinorhizobium medicae]